MNVFLIHEIFYNCRKNFNLRDKITIQIDNELCSMETCYVCRNDKYETIKKWSFDWFKVGKEMQCKDQ